MKTSNLFIASILAASLFTLSSCNFSIKGITEHAKKELKESHEYRDSEKWGKVTERQIQIADFTELESFGNVEIKFTQDSLTSIKAIGNEKAIDAYEFDVQAGILYIGLKDKNATNVNQNTPAITLLINANRLDKIALKGSGDLDFENDINFPYGLNISTYGAGDIETENITTSALTVEIFGAGDLKMQKVKCEGNVKISINGAGDVESKTIECANLKLDISGAGDADLKVKCNELRAECRGAGDIKLKGECNRLIKKDGPMGAIDSRELKVKSKVALSSDSSPKEGE